MSKNIFIIFKPYLYKLKINLHELGFIFAPPCGGAKMKVKTNYPPVTNIEITLTIENDTTATTTPATPHINEDLAA